ncbi:unnamed protein product [Urochloa humidicola]
MRQLLLAFLFLFLPYATFSAAAAAAGGGACNRRCNSLVVPYPFGFSGDCPILLTCNATASTPLLPLSTAATATAAHPIMSFDSNASTFVVAVAVACNRTVSETRASLTGAGYGVSSHTGIFLRGGCAPSPPANNSSSSSSCSVPSELMTKMLRTAQCAGGGGGSGNGTAAAAWTCVTSAPPDAGSAAAARGEGQFMAWESVEAAGCHDALTSAVYGDSPQGVPSVEFGVAELGWWLDGRCGGGGGAPAANATTGGAGAGECAANATCRDVETPSGAWGHRCSCGGGMIGDGFAAGEGCRYGEPAGECFPSFNHWLR